MKITPPLGLPQLPLVWTALAIDAAGQIASSIAREMSDFAMGGPGRIEPSPQPCWTSEQTVALALESVTLRNFSRPDSRDDGGVPALICAPLALHRATVADFARDHSLAAALLDAGIHRLFVTDWCSATPQMRFRTLDSYFSDLNVMVDVIGAPVDLIGLCQGGWMALAYAARYPAKVRKLVLAAAPLDVAAGATSFSQLASLTPYETFHQIVALGDGIVEGARAQRLWPRAPADDETIWRTLRPRIPIGSDGFATLRDRFRIWSDATIDLPGRLYLEIVEHIFKGNALASGGLTVLGRPLDLAAVKTPLFLLAGDEDAVVAPEQVFAIERVIGTPADARRKMIVSCDHLGLFLSQSVLEETWPIVARWLLDEPAAQLAPCAPAA